MLNARVIVGSVGAATVLLGLGGLFYPAGVMGFVGFAAQTSQEAGAHGEMRAVYGGMLIAAGVFTLLSAPDPRGHQARLVLLGMLWIGTGAGRLFGIFADGNPGLVGWFSLVVELGGGGALLYASQAPTEAEMQTAPIGSEAPGFRA